MGKILAVSLTFFLLVLASPLLAQDDTAYEPFSPDQLDNLLAPIALYPDPLLAQVLVAATFPDQIDEAARFIREGTNGDDVDDHAWDVSVKAVAHYPEVLDMMADKLDWTTSLGQAYVSQSTDVMASVQRLRGQAQTAGNLETTPEMQVVDSGGEIGIWPAQPQYLFVPEYDPAVVFFSRGPLFFHNRFLIGSWLNVDFDWRLHRVFYHGWEHGWGWMERSRPFVHVNNIYVNNRYRNVVFNRNVIHQRVNYRMLNRYDDVHRQTNFDTFHSHDRGISTPPHPPISNKIINRNIDVGNPRLNEHRGYSPAPSALPQPPPVPAFTPFHGGFDPHQASQRGQTSRATVKAPPPPQPSFSHPSGHHDERKRP